MGRTEAGGENVRLFGVLADLQPLVEAEGTVAVAAGGLVVVGFFLIVVVAIVVVIAAEQGRDGGNGAREFQGGMRCSGRVWWVEGDDGAVGEADALAEGGCGGACGEGDWEEGEDGKEEC